MRLLLDQGTPLTLAALLRQTGSDALHTAEMGLAKADDSEILRRAAAEDRVIVTLDADLHALLARAKTIKPSIIRFRIEGLRAQAFSDLLKDVLKRCRGDLETGALVSVQEGRIRVRQLPLP